MIVSIVAIISFAIVILAICGMRHDANEKKMKIEATLRAEEMRHGYMPGTYSRSFSSKKAYKEMRKEDRRAYRSTSINPELKPNINDEMDKEQFEKAISDLEKRINNLDTIMRGREK